MTAHHTQKTFKAGETIMTQGEQGHSAYILETGRVDIQIKTPDGQKQSVGTRGKGSIIGEMALVDKAPRTATVIALEDCEVLEITQDDFQRRLDASDPVLKMTTQVIMTRYRDTLARAHIRGESLQWPPPEMVELGYTSGDAVENIKIANDFAEALEKRELALHYQPIVNLQKNNAVAGFEALMRWTHAERGFISPSVFIPVAEESGLIVEASKWALEESCSALKRMEGATGTPAGQLFMSVNFTSHDFAADDFVGTVNDIITKTGTHTEQVHVEITERLLMDQPDNARETLEQCRTAGLSIAIDDFGTGYSSLSYLHYFPIDTLKIDRSFVMDMHRNESSMALIKSIIALAQNMKMKTIAEGVETAQEAEALRELGCDMAQGYYFAKPMAEADVIGFLKK